MFEQAVIFCGGKGKRLMPITKNIPKPMVKINDINFLQILINQLKKNNCKEIILLTGYKYKVIHDYIKFNKIKSVNCILTKVDYDTGERIKNIENKLDSNFFLMYGDNYINFSFEKHLKNIDQNSLIHLVIQNKNLANEEGNIKIEEKSKNIFYHSKRNIKCGFVEMGYSLVKSDFIKKHDFKSFNDYIILASELRKLTYTKITNKYLSITNTHVYSDTKKWFLKNKKLYNKIY
tara:strand:- start:752 stop:1453 length:702 start_codon:yes stop_codon:yes gene_type:complete